MDRIRLSLILALLLMATVFLACQPEASKPGGDTEGATEPEAAAVEDETGPAATGPSEAVSEGIAEEEGFSTEVTPAEGEEEGKTEEKKEEAGGSEETPEEGSSEEVKPGEKEPPAKADPAGMTVYKAQCTKCHKVSGRDDLGSGPMDLAGMKDKYNAETMREKMSTHPPGADPYTKTLSEKELKDLILFLLTL